MRNDQESPFGQNVSTRMNGNEIKSMLPSSNHSQPAAQGYPDHRAQPQTQSATPNRGIPSRSSNDPDVKARIRHKQQRLLLLHHSAKCPHEDNRCTVTPHCAEMKQLWQHMGACKDNDCKVTHCFSSRAILSHYHKCRDPNCPACVPARETVQKSRSSSWSTGPLMNSMRELKLSMSNDPLGALSGGGLLFNPQGATPPPVAQNQAPPMYPLQQQPPSTSSQSISQQHFSGTDINRNLTSTRPAINMCELNVFESSRGAVVTSGSSTHSNKFTTGNFTSGAASLFLRPGSSKKNDADWQKVRNKQQRLLLLRHASRCQHETGQCPVTPHCASMKELLEHIAVCKNRTCTVQHCRSSRYILRHYRRCKDTHCPTCRPVREKNSKIYSTRKNKCETVSRTFFI